VRWDEAWVGKCGGCAAYGTCHGTIDPGPPIPEPVGNALEALYAANLPVRAVLAALWDKGAS
jgi:ferredoxin